MHWTTRVGSTFVTLGLLAVLAPDARASILPPCGQTCSTTCTYTPARYTNGGAGDVALNINSGTPSGLAMAPLAGALGLNYYHAKLLYDGTGQRFAETYWNGVSPPDSSATGEPHVCSRPISPNTLQRLPPGSGVYYEDAQPGVLVKSFGTPGCSVPAELYHFNSFLHDDVRSGSCEKLLVDSCAVPVNATLDRTVYNAAQAFGAVNAVFSETYKACMQAVGNSAPFNNFFGISGLGCGGTSEQTMCQRAGWQVVNEIIWKAYPLEYWGLGACNSYGCGYMDGDSDFAANGDMLGGAKSNGEMTQTYGPTHAINSPLCPGACDDGSCNNDPIACASYEPTAWVANVPDNIAHAATRLGKTIVSATVAAGYNTCRTVCTPTGICPGS